MSAFANPIIIAATGQAVLLNRIPLTSSAGDQFNERWLQEALYRNPETLPVMEIDPHIGSLIPICMEIETGSGPADILFVTPTGQVVLVETKLWRNPEARREVVGQILDYAKHLTSWSFEQLSERAGIASGEGKNRLISCFKAQFPDADESAFVDGVQRSLSSGDFLLLIVGDGIRAGAESLVSFLERYGNMRFSLGLIEVAAYQLPDGSRLLQPRILAKTELLQRTILIGPNGPVTFQQAAQQEDAAAAPNTSQREWFITFWKEFLDQLRLDDTSLMPEEPAKSTNQYFAVVPGGFMWISAYVAQSTNRGGVYLTFARSYEHKHEIYGALVNDRDAVEREAGERLSWTENGDKYSIDAPLVSFKDLNEPNDRSRVILHLARMSEKMIRVLKPRVETAISDIG